MRAEAAPGLCGLVLEACDGSIALGDAKTLAPASYIRGVGRAMRAPARRRMIMPGPPRGRVDLERDFSAHGIDRGSFRLLSRLFPPRLPVSIVIAGASD